MIEIVGWMRQGSRSQVYIRNKFYDVWVYIFEPTVVCQK